MLTASLPAASQPRKPAGATKPVKPTKPEPPKPEPPKPEPEPPKPEPAPPASASASASVSPPTTPTTPAPPTTGEAPKPDGPPAPVDPSKPAADGAGPKVKPLGPLDAPGNQTGPVTQTHAIALGGAGVIALGASAIFGVMALSAKSDYDKQPTIANATDIESNAALSTGSLLLGVILAGASALFFLLPPPTPPPPPAKR